MRTCNYCSTGLSDDMVQCLAINDSAVDIYKDRSLTVSNINGVSVVCIEDFGYVSDTFDEDSMLYDYI